MASAFGKNFMPKMQYKGQPYQSDSEKYEGVKARIDGSLVLVESCLGKCNADFTANGIGANGDACMTKCYNKYFDASLLVHKEVTLYTVAMNNL